MTFVRLPRLGFLCNGTRTWCWIVVDHACFIINVPPLQDQVVMFFAKSMSIIDFSQRSFDCAWLEVSSPERAGAVGRKRTTVSSSSSVDLTFDSAVRQNPDTTRRPSKTSKG